MNKRALLLLLFFGLGLMLEAQPVKLGLLKYDGGGDWYSNPTSLPNLIKFCNQQLNTNINPEPVTVAVTSRDIFRLPFIHMTGHGNVVFSESAVENLRLYLESGGFLHIDDNYGMDKFVRREMKKVFPKLDFVELSFNHPIYHKVFPFANGLPKVHEHDNKPPQGFGLIYKNRLVCFYTYESDLGDGWEDPSVHNDSPEKHLEALKMGANIISFVFTDNP
jgi:hypothetical protein